MTGITGLLVAAVSAALYLLFKYSLIFCALGALLGVAAFVVSLLKDRKKAISIVCVVLSLVCMFFASYQKDTHPVATVVREVVIAESKEPAKADALLTALADGYDGYNGIYFALARAKMNQGKYDEAIEALERSTENPSEYYLLKMQIVAHAAQNGTTCRYLGEKDNWLEVIQDIAFDAIENSPDFAFGHTMAGAMTYQLDKACTPALYCLSGSLSFNYEDGNTWYYLGLVEYYMENYDEAMDYFENAQKYGTTDEIGVQLTEYISLAEKGGAK